MDRFIFNVTLSDFDYVKDVLFFIIIIITWLHIKSVLSSVDVSS